MRITNNMMITTLLSNLERNMSRMSKYQDKLATGKEVIRASDDPVATSGILKYRSDIASLTQYEKNTGDSMAWMEVTESSIADIGTVLQRMRELAVQAANGTNTVDDTEKIAKEIEQLKQHLIVDGNANFAGRYCFTGYQTDKELFNADGTYKIDITQADIVNRPTLKYQVSIAQEIDVTTNGIDIFGVLNPPEAPYTLETLLPSDPVDRAASSTAAAATKSTLTTTAPFNLAGTYAPGSLGVTVNGTAYTIPPVGVTLDGASVPLTKEAVIQTYQGVLGTNADVYFNTQDQLVIKATTFGAVPVAGAGYTAAVGTPHTEAVLTGGALPGAIVWADLPGSSFFLTVNDVRKQIQIPTTAVIGNAAQLISELQTAIDSPQTGFGPGKVTVGGGAGGITFTTAGTPAGESASIAVEHIVAKRSQLISDVDTFIAGLKGTGPASDITDFLGKLDTHLNQVLSVRADIGARVNRMELIANRIAENTVSFTKMLSDAQDANMAGVIMFLKNAENVYKASLSTGAKVVQPSLIDFIR